MKWTFSRLSWGIRHRGLQARNNRRIAALAVGVERQAGPQPDERPVAFFNASSRLAWMSQNAAFTLLASWGVRLGGAPVIYFVCRSGMSRCQLGTNKDDPSQPPPCAVCVAQSEHLYARGQVHWFDYQADSELEAVLQDLPLADLQQFTWQDFPLGELVLPSLRWALRCHDLPDDEGARFLLRQYVLSAWRVAVEFRRFLAEHNPRGLVVFNGISFPEAVARRIALESGLWVVTHEVGLQPLSAYFTHGQATAYPIDIPDDFQLSDKQHERLNAYLEKRIQGKFSMAGVQFWPEIRGLGQDFLKKAAGFKQIVPVFTNVIFDTSQVHANQVFSDMFAWLDAVLELVKAYPETFFVIRAHPDEDRPGKQARASVAAWVAGNQVTELPNVWFVPPRAYLSSYELIQRSKFVMIYNSTIGLEAAILGAPVLCAGRARFTQLPTVYFPGTPETYLQMAEDFLEMEKVPLPAEFPRNARRFLYYQLYKTSLPLQMFLGPDLPPGFVLLRDKLTWRDLLPDNSASMRAIVEGILQGGSFLLPDGEGEQDG